jgi:S1-C subfamily serine protease
LSDFNWPDEGRQDTENNEAISRETTPYSGQALKTTNTKNNGIRVLLLFSLISALLGGLIGAAVVMYAFPQHRQIVETFKSNQSVLAQPSESQIKSVIEKTLPSVVYVEATTATSQDEGTGMVISPTGLIVTNNHVISGSNSISVILYGSSTPVPAYLVSSDTADDIALLEIPGAHGLTPATFGNSNNIYVGEYTLAIGYALGFQGQPTVTNGIISAIGRSIAASNIIGSVNEKLQNVIQTDAAINPGNSGGPLVDMNGNVIGMNTAAATDATGNEAQDIGFAIPIAEVEAILPTLEAHQSVNTPKATLGVTVTELTAQMRSFYGIGPVPASGALVTGVNANGPAAIAGIRIGDVITQLGSSPITDPATLNATLAGYLPGQSVNIIVFRQGAPLTLPVTLG